MNIQELKEYINTNIKTNGKGEISGEKMNEVLNGIVDAIEGPTLTITMGEPGYEFTKEEFATNLGITESEVDKLFNGEYNKIECDASSFKHIVTLSNQAESDNVKKLLFGGTDNSEFGFTIYVARYIQSGMYAFATTEV